MKEMWFPLGMLILKKKLYDTIKAYQKPSLVRIIPQIVSLFHHDYNWSNCSQVFYKKVFLKKNSVS